MWQAQSLSAQRSVEQCRKVKCAFAMKFVFLVVNRAGVFRAGPLAAADALAGLLGLGLDETHARGGALVGLTVDLSTWGLGSAGWAGK